MKFKLNHKIATLVFIICFSLSFGQKVEFTVPKNIETLENIIFKFENKFTKDEPKAAAAGGESFSTTVDLYNLKYEAGNSNPYLELALKKGAKPKQFIEQANWNVTFNKISKKNTKVTIFLETVVPDRLSKKEVDTKLTRSTGKVEKEIQEFLLHYKESKTSAASDAMVAVDAADVAAAEAQAEAAIADIQARNSIKKTTSGKLQALFSKKEFISLPTSSDAITKLLQIQPREIECGDCKNGKYSSWDIDEVFNLIYTRMNDGQEYYALQYYDDQKVGGLPYGLVFNESSPTECKKKFARYNAQLYQTTVDTDANSSSVLTVVTFKMNTNFVRLEFGNQYLSRIVVSNKEQ